MIAIDNKMKRSVGRGLLLLGTLAMLALFLFPYGFLAMSSFKEARAFRPPFSRKRFPWKITGR